MALHSLARVDPDSRAPHSVEVEQALLGGLLLDPGAWGRVADAINVDDFYGADHRLIFEAIRTLVERDQPADAVTVVEHLERDGSLDAAGGPDYIARIVKETPSAANVLGYAKIVRGHAKGRVAYEIGAKLVRDAGNGDITELASDADALTGLAIDRGANLWGPPVPLPEGLPPVPAFDLELLPPLVRRRVEDIADRMQCPAEFPAVTIMAMLSAAVGRRCGVRPKRRDDWLVIPNLWGMAVGRPGVLKTPAIEEALKPLRALQSRALERHAAETKKYEAESMVRAQAKNVTKDLIKAALKKKNITEAERLALATVGPDDEEPTAERFVVNDCTVEKLGEILSQNQNGVLLYRDELSGFFNTLERQGHESDRAFYLEAWNGDNNFVYDRIGRGTLNIPSVCVSVLGTIQPGPLSNLVRGMRGKGDDGLLQRFQLAVWPDTSRQWTDVDRRPDQRARDDVGVLIEKLVSMNSGNTGAVLAVQFDDGAQGIFDSWRAALEKRLRDDSLHPTLEAHIAKYRKLVPALALLAHLADEPSVSSVGPIREDSVIRAIAWAEFLEPHAQRIYAPAISPDLDAARALANKIKKGDIGARFALRDVYRNGWASLATREEALAAVRVLVEYEWLRENAKRTAGRTRTVYELNPLVTPGEQ